jgi:hypothetical protein
LTLACWHSDRVLLFGCLQGIQPPSIRLRSGNPPSQGCGPGLSCLQPLLQQAICTPPAPLHSYDSSIIRMNVHATGTERGDEQQSTLKKRCNHSFMLCRVAHHWTEGPIYNQPIGSKCPMVCAKRGQIALSKKPKDSRKTDRTAPHPTKQTGLPVRPNTTTTPKIQNSPAGSL